tara:strand:- start:29 stop:562 length:534 start_codon:yes stop_codon:yes gene_type:complete
MIKPLLILTTLVITLGLISQTDNNQNIEIKGGVENLPEWGVVNFDFDKYYPGILDTIKLRRITTANKVRLNPGNGIIVSMLINSGTFEQMFLCTHDSTSKLIDSYYIGTSAMYDNRKAYNIEKKILNQSTIQFHHTDLEEINKNGVWEMDTLNYDIKTASIDSTGHITIKNESITHR